jgi:peptidyl-prolyl cis-trans isomerase A (cyclophilin A)
MHASRARLVVTCVLGVVVVASCHSSPDEPQIKADDTSKAIPTAAPVPKLQQGNTNTNTNTNAAANPVFQQAQAKVNPADPLQGKFTLADATKGIPGTGALLATIDTNHGKVTCKLFEDKAPVTVANFVGLATGKRTWRNPTGQWVNTPAYDGTTFHRIIKDFMIQGGDAAGTGSGDPGYGIPDEMWDGGLHDRAGLLCMANRGAGTSTNGAQFFITESDGPSVKGLDHYHSYSIFGECAPLSVVHEIASVPTSHPGDRPLTPVTINKVTIAREKH